MGDQIRGDEPSLRASPTLSPIEALVLSWMLDVAGEEYAYGFAPIAGALGLDRSTVRAACRSLTAKRLFQFSRGLFTEDGALAGAGYGCTRAAFDIRDLPHWEDVLREASEGSRKDGSSPQNTEAQ